MVKGRVVMSDQGKKRQKVKKKIKKFDVGGNRTGDLLYISRQGTLEVKGEVRGQKGLHIRILQGRKPPETHESHIAPLTLQTL